MRADGGAAGVAPARLGARLRGYLRTRELPMVPCAAGGHRKSSSVPAGTCARRPAGTCSGRGRSACGPPDQGPYSSDRTAGCSAVVLLYGEHPLTKETNPPLRTGAAGESSLHLEDQDLLPPP